MLTDQEMKKIRKRKTMMEMRRMQKMPQSHYLKIKRLGRQDSNALMRINVMMLISAVAMALLKVMKNLKLRPFVDMVKN